MQGVAAANDSCLQFEHVAHFLYRKIFYLIRTDRGQRRSHILAHERPLGDDGHLFALDHLRLQSYILRCCQINSDFEILDPRFLVAHHGDNQRIVSRRQVDNIKIALQVAGVAHVAAFDDNVRTRQDFFCIRVQHLAGNLSGCTGHYAALPQAQQQ